jgi:hypothetical protein
LIRDALAGDAWMTANCTGGVHLGAAPDSATMPYLVYSAPGLSGEIGYNTGRQQIEEVYIRLQVWAASPDTAAAIIERAEAVLLARNSGLAWKHMDARKIGADCFQEEERDPDGNEVWQAAMTMEFMLHWDPRA